MQQRPLYLLIILSSSLWSSHEAFAGSVVTLYVNGCEDPGFYGPYIPVPDRWTGKSYGGGGVVYNESFQQYTRSTAGPPLGLDVACGILKHWTTYTNVDIVGVDSEIVWRLKEAIKGRIRNRDRTRINQGADGNPPPRFRVPTCGINCGAGAGIRGSVDTSGGWTLSEASPAYIVFDAVVDLSSSDPVATIPFIVDNVGDGDWLSLYSGSEMFFHQPLSNFVVGELYFVAVPFDVLATFGDQLFTYWIDDTSDGNASVYFPDVVTERLAVDIDVDPWSAVNEVRPASNNLIAVAVKGSNVAAGDDRDFDATQINPASLQLGVGEAANVATPLVADFDGDTLTDVAFGFRTQDTGVFCGDTEVTLVGETFAGDPFTGTDTISTTDCVDTGCHP